MATLAQVVDTGVSTAAQLEALCAAKPTAVFFWAAWHEPSKGQMTQVFDALAGQFGAQANFVKLEAETVPEISAKHGVSVVPTFLFLKAGGELMAKIEGADAPGVAAKLQALVASGAQGAPATSAPAAGAGSQASEPDAAMSLNDRLARLVSSAPVMLFMKGDPSNPRCKFSRQIVELLGEEKIPYGSFDILQDEEVRAGLKVYSDWQTYPQLYAQGELIGGIDVVKDMQAEDESLAVQLGLADATTTDSSGSAAMNVIVDVTQRCKHLMKRSKVILFMKGNPDEPRCGFSRKCVALLREEKVAFDSFDILTDEEVRQKLKELSEWPTYPQLYVDGELVGGLDVIQELKDSGDLKETLAGSESSE